ncbi:DNA polymerase IV [Acetobacteraceae bacterium KSS8]|uniref:DNA polymerase IV n=1 Tax=Endosaccharibacter trunci TaxID=2812733 RepID=A0ABT1W338_9PROT|nr:DNA polymerase IV [Acetobacteraceae bacterium KSS8]
MDAFYASVEQRDDPALRGRPLAVGGSRERGVVAAASYEARRFGVRSAMPSVTARRLCPELVFVSPRFEVYKAVSRQIRAIFEDYTDLIQPLSLDEAYLDVTAPKRDLGSATAIAREIRARIRAETGLTASAGVSYNKFLAKLASDHRKPDGLFVITPAQGASFVEDLTVDRFHGVGPVTARKMRGLGIETGADLRAQTLPFLLQHFGKAGPHYHAIARGLDDRPVVTDRPRKSLGAENTFSRDLTELPNALAVLEPIVDKVWSGIARGGRFGRTVTLKVKFSDFTIITRAASSERGFTSREAVFGAASTLLRSVYPFRLSVRLLGVSVSRFGEGPADSIRHGDLFEPTG